MRRVLCTLIVVVALGCRNQSMPLANPFLAPNRVPPPATRTLLPGTAQPYYPGDPVPNSPAIGVPTTVAPPASTYAPPPAYSAPQPGSTTPTTPPGGWSTGPVSSTTPNNWSSGVQQASVQAPLNNSPESAVQVPTDNEGLRFGTTTQSQIAQASYESSPVTPTEAEQLTSQQLSVIPAQYAQLPADATHRDVAIRQIASSELPEPTDGSSPAPIRAGRDGFRPQGSSRPREDEPTRPNENAAAQDITPTPEPVSIYGFDPQYRWLRGQLIYSPTTGQWQLQYVQPGAIADSLGGIMPITNPQVLANLQHGELVSVEGRLEMLQLDAMSVVPAYTVTVLQRQQQVLR